MRETRKPSRPGSKAAPRGGPRQRTSRDEAPVSRGMGSRSGPPRPRQALTPRASTIETWGSVSVSATLRDAFEAQRDMDPDALTHGFHTYPARMHWSFARTIIRAVNGDVLDPFVGSGTTVIEAMVAGHRAVGLDLNPIAIRLTEVKSDVRDAEARARFMSEVSGIVERSTERVQDRVPAKAPLAPIDRELWDTHVAIELAGLLAELRKAKNPADVRALEMVFSAIIMKFSKRTADTGEGTTERRVRKGLVTEFFGRKASELANRWAALDEAAQETIEAGGEITRPKLELSDVSRAKLRVPRGWSPGLVLTSPPYGGTYDYSEQHRLRAAWLGINFTSFTKGELGSRRRYGRVRTDLPVAQRKGQVTSWSQEVVAMLRTLHSLVARDGFIVVVVGDARIGEVTVDALEQYRELAADADLTPVASASERARGSLREHAIVFSRRS